MIGFPKSDSSREVLSCLDLINLGLLVPPLFFCLNRRTARVVVGHYGIVIEYWEQIEITMSTLFAHMTLASGRHLSTRLRRDLSGWIKD